MGGPKKSGKKAGGMGGGGKGSGTSKNQSEAERIKALEAELSRLNKAHDESEGAGELCRVCVSHSTGNSCGFVMIR
jgi:hypothetical protein